MLLFYRKGYTLLEIMIVVAVIAAILAIVITSYIRVIESSVKNACITNLKQIDAAMDRWAFEDNIEVGTQPTSQQIEEIYEYVSGGEPKCPRKGEYSIYRVGDKPQVRCSLEDEGHKLPE